MKRIYMDYAATTPTHPDVVEAMRPYFTDAFGNPSSIYSYGQEARGAVGDARESVAGLIGARSEEVVFTSGGTEADNFAIKGVLHAARDGLNHVVTSAIEHHAVIETCSFLERHGYRVTLLPVDATGLVDPADLKTAITPETAIVSIMHANNEIGTIEPIAELAAIAKEAGVCFHTDAVQTVGQIPVNVDDLGVDLLSMSAHKLYGPKGVGALFIRKGTRMSALLRGGGQERNRRGGTENVPGIVGFGKAAEMASSGMIAEADRQRALRDRLTAAILAEVEDSRLNGHPTQRLPNNVNISIAYIEGESMLLNLDLEGICASTGSASCCWPSGWRTNRRTARCASRWASGTRRQTWTAFWRCSPRSSPSLGPCPHCSRAADRSEERRCLRVSLRTAKK
jgi:cysteine desulfurase